MKINARNSKHMTRKLMCAKCKEQSILDIRWIGYDDLWCPRCGNTTEFEPAPKSLHQQWKENPDSIPVHVANKFADRYADEIEQIVSALPEEAGRAIREKYLGIVIPIRRE